MYHMAVTVRRGSLTYIRVGAGLEGLLRRLVPYNQAKDNIVITIPATTL